MAFFTVSFVIESAELPIDKLISELLKTNQASYNRRQELLENNNLHQEGFLTKIAYYNVQTCE